MAVKTDFHPILTGLAVFAGSAVVAKVAQTLTIRSWAAKPALFPPADFLLDGETHEIATEDGASLFAISADPHAGTQTSPQTPTVIMGHGIAGDHTHWAPIANRLLADGCRVVVFDQRGHGSSLAGSDGFGLRGLANDAAAIVSQLGGSGRIVYAGHSMGGIGLQSMLRHHPEVAAKVDGFAFVATLSEPVGGPIAKILGSPGGLRLYRRILANRPMARMALRSGFGDRFSLACIDQLHRTWNQTTDETLIGLGEDLADFDFAGDLAVVSAESVVICGADDNVTPLGLSRKIKAAVPDAELVVIDDAGHMIVWEHVERVSGLLSDMASRQGSGRRNSGEKSQN